VPDILKGPLFENKSFPQKSGVIKYDPNRPSLELDFGKLELPGVLRPEPRERLKLDLPKEWGYPSTKSRQITFDTGVFFLGGLKDELGKKRNETDITISQLKKQNNSYGTYDQSAEFNLRKNAFRRESKPDKEIADENQR